MSALKIAHIAPFLLTLGCLAAGRASPGQSWLLLIGFLSLLHFSSTLFLFYHKGSVWRERPVLSWVFPGSFLVLAFILAMEAPDAWAMALVFFFPLLFWHYAKQAMGVYLLGLERTAQLARPNSALRQLVLLCFLVMGVFGYLSSQTGGQLTQAFGFYIPTLKLDIGPWINGMRTIALGSALFLLVLSFWQRKLLSALTVVAFYFWMDLFLTNFALAIFLPALHAVQYIPLAFSRWSKRFPAIHFIFAGAALAVVLLVLLRFSPRGILWVSLLLSSMEVVLNVHHYFVDAFIWRAREETVRKELGI